jgi:hypothetical protein
MLDQFAAAAGQPIPTNAPGAPTPEALLGDMVQKNPKLAWLMQMMSAGSQRVAVAESAAAEERQAEFEALADQLQQSEIRAAKLQRIARRLQSELEEAQERLADLAAAFGACGLCFGQDNGCRSCRGRGKLGMFAADPELRRRFVAEAITTVPTAPASVSPAPSFRPQP